MQSILIQPKNSEELQFVQMLLEKLHIRNAIIDNEEVEDIKNFDKVVKKIQTGKAEFFTLDEVKKTLNL